jgi:hypothetical protein
MTLRKIYLRTMLLLSLLIIVFLIAMRIVIMKNIIAIDDNFLGMNFHAFRVYLFKANHYLPIFFIVTFFSSFIAEKKGILRYILIGLSIAGYFVSDYMNDHIAPW